MSVNYFQGTIPSELGRLLNLTYLQISENNLSGVVPPSIYNISSLRHLDFTYNQFDGKIPQDIGFTFPNLLGLYLGGNQFTGHLPISLSNASGLQEFNFAENNFTGTMLTNLGSLKDLVRLTVAGNQLETDKAEGFSFLTSLTNCSNLQALNIAANRFQGELPASIANFSTALQQLIVGENPISGSIPEGITSLIGLTRLVITISTITGEIPESIGTLERLEDLRMYDNRISGAIPETIGNITQLGQLYLFGNNLSGNIPPSLGNCKRLEGDVYSFGILLLEMFTGRKPTDMAFEDSQNIHQFTKAALPERVMEIAEPSLFSEVGGEDDDNKTREGKIKDCLVAMLKIGVSCSMEAPGERMDMRDVVAEFCRIRTKTFRH
ncbi:hypothetical protein RHMOL_Rhmol13G0087000 [Rhododendron molle]|uniref:Uncharacterized protein n=1 Tax=Rhododendron molle TaxID=49168 RepID=A0ACC0L5F1_RHOML|nr:hypothetical protein RHMOL_Rhmol13G0087000 [Rhododendron molle]